jgi:hypothetical protein
MADINRLPAGFEELERFVEHWDVPTSHERWVRRSQTSLPDIKRFYDAMLARADDAVSYVERFPLHDLPDDAGRLLRLLLAMTQAAMAVELHEAARVPHSPFPHSLKITVGVQPFG